MNKKPKILHDTQQPLPIHCINYLQQETTSGSVSQLLIEGCWARRFLKHFLSPPILIPLPPLCGAGTLGPGVQSCAQLIPNALCSEKAARGIANAASDLAQQQQVEGAGIHTRVHNQHPSCAAAFRLLSSSSSARCQARPGEQQHKPRAAPSPPDLLPCDRSWLHRLSQMVYAEGNNLTE